ncbi:MAG TPA: nuclear transport factor 2 family protein [Pirellulales bacterium]
MSQANRLVLQAANAAIRQGDYEGFLAFCTDDAVWTFVGERTLTGKDAVRRWMATAYREPPRFTVAQLISDGDFVVALGEITTTSDDGQTARSSYCDVWHFRAGKLAELRAFVVEIQSENEPAGSA